MKVYNAIKKRAVAGDVGIEIETEGRNLWHPEGSLVWKAEQDGSLRGENLEYIFKKPLPINDVRAAMQELNNGFEARGSKLDYSFRTSVHVHVNVGQLEFDALLAFMYAYLVLERVLTRYCGEERLGNRFCLRYEDAEGLSEAVGLLMKHGANALREIPQDQYRYAAMNIDSLRKYGSLEFRAMRGTNDEDIVSNWAQVLVNLRDYAEALGNPQEVFEAVQHFGPRKFAEQALGNMFEVFDHKDLESDIRYSFSITLDMPFAWKKEEVRNKQFENPFQPVPIYDPFEPEFVEVEEEEEDEY
jgi:hypothetical protein